jgi:hypothetical protein
MFNNANVDGQIVRESIIAGTISASVLAVDYYGGSRIITVSSPASNFTVNLTNPPVDNNETINLNIVVTQGATGRLANAFSINGTGQTLRWVGGVTPTPTNSKIDIFSFTIIRQSDAWTVLGQASLNF